MASSSEASAGRRLEHDEGSQNLMRLHVGQGRQGRAGRMRPAAGNGHKRVLTTVWSGRSRLRPAPIEVELGLH